MIDMTATLNQIAAWPIDERLELVQQVWNHIADSDWQPSLSEEQQRELDRRLSALEANPDDVITWDEIESHVRRQQ